MTKKRLSLPAPERLTVSGVSIYQGGGEVTLRIVNGLTAVLGANGLGKSTLLNLLLYGITGVVRTPGGALTPLKGARGFFGQSEDYARKYFDGRVKREASGSAFVEVAFLLGGARFVVRRGFLERSAVTALSIDGRSYPAGAALEEKYRDSICSYSGFFSFEQFAFNVQTLQAFGEDRLCLLWEQVALSQIFFTLASGDPAEGERLASSVEEFKRADSNVRNTQWQITRERKMLEALTVALSKKRAPSASTLESYAELSARRDQLDARLEELSEKWSEALAKRDELLIQREGTTRELENATWKALKQRSIALAETPPARNFVNTGICPFCSTEHKRVPDRVSASIANGECPLCAADVKHRPKPDGQAIREHMEELRRAKARLDKSSDELSARANSLKKEQQEAQAESQRVRQQIEKLERVHGQEILEARTQLRKKGLNPMPVT